MMFTGLKLGGAGDLRMYAVEPLVAERSGVSGRRRSAVVPEYRERPSRLGRRPVVVLVSGSPPYEDETVGSGTMKGSGR